MFRLPVQCFAVFGARGPGQADQIRLDARAVPGLPWQGSVPLHSLLVVWSRGSRRLVRGRFPAGWSGRQPLPERRPCPLAVPEVPAAGGQTVGGPYLHCAWHSSVPFWAVPYSSGHSWSASLWQGLSHPEAEPRRVVWASSGAWRTKNSNAEGSHAWLWRAPPRSPCPVFVAHVVAAGRVMVIRPSKVKLQGNHALERTTRTGHCAWLTTWVETEPRCNPGNPP